MQKRLAVCKIRGPPIAVSVHGRTELVRANPRTAIDLVFAMWLAVSSDMEVSLEGEEDAGDSDGNGGQMDDLAAEVRWKRMRA